MTQHKPKINQEFDPEFLSAGAKIVEYLPKFASIIVSLAIFGYIIGWLNANSYYKQFGATWLVNDLTTIELLSFSTTTIVFLGVVIFNFINNFTEGPPRLMVSQWVYIICTVISITAPLSAKYFIAKNDFSMAMAFSVLGALSCSHMAMIMFYRSVETIAKHGYKYRFNVILSFIIACYFGLYLVPINMGEANGKRDSSKFSNLPEVVAKDPKLVGLRLLRAKGDIYYATNLTEKGASQEIYIITKDQIVALRAYNSNTQKQNLRQ